jgi:hypothetical protein
LGKCALISPRTEHFWKIYDLIKSKRVSISSNIIQKSKFHTQNRSRCSVTLYKFLWSFFILWFLTLQNANESDFPFIQHGFLWFLMCVALLSQLVRNYDYLYSSDHFHIFAFDPKYFQNNLTAADVFMWDILIHVKTMTVFENIEMIF